MLNPETPLLSKAFQGKRPEEKLLFFCSRTQLSESSLLHIQSLCQESSLDWDVVMHLANSHAVSSLLFNSLQRACPNLVPEAVLFELRTEYRKNLIQNLKLTAELVRVVELLREHGIQSVAFKGPVLAQAIYGGTALRQMGDLDLLVTKENFDAVQEVLTEDGYQMELSLPWERHFISLDGSFLIDLHTQPTPPHQSCNLPPEYWWSQLTSVSLKGSSIQTFTAEAQIVMLFLHGTKDCWHKLSRICDVAELLRSQPDLDWIEVLGLAQKHGYKRLIYWGLWLAHEVLDAPIPAHVVQQAYAEPTVQMLVEEVYEDMFTKEPWVISDAERTLSFIRAYDRFGHKLVGRFRLFQFYFWAITKIVSQQDDFTVPREYREYELRRGIKMQARSIAKIPRLVKLKLKSRLFSR